jgi:hypothetical protein
MTYAESVALVVKMRIAQRNYYGHRTMANLVAAKDLERAVDAAALRFGEMTMFPEANTNAN